MNPSERIPKSHAMWTAFAAVLLMMVGVGLWYFTPGNVLFGGIAVIAGIALLYKGTDSESDDWPYIPPVFAESAGADKRLRFPLRLLLLVPAVGLSVYAAWYAGNITASFVSIWLALGLWVSAIGLAFMAFVPWSELQYWISEASFNVQMYRYETLFVVLLTIGAFLIRVIGLDSLPSVMFPQEARFGLQAASLFHDWAGFSTESHFLQAVAIRLFGQTFAAVRFPSVILGALTIPGVYLAARRMFSPRVAVVAALFLAAFPLHSHFSRIGLNQTFDALVAVWTFAFLARALITGSRVEYAFAGIGIGLSQYGSVMAGIVPLLALIYTVAILLRQRSDYMPNKRWVLIPLFMALIVLLPQLYSLVTQQSAPIGSLFPNAIWQETGTEFDLHSNSRRWFLLIIMQVLRSFLGYVAVPDAGTLYAASTPMLGWLNVVPFMIGFFLTFLRLRDPHWLLLLLWVSLTSILGGVLFIQPPQYQRFVIAAPALAILFALGLLYISDLLAQISRKLSPEYVYPRFVELWMLPLAIAITLFFYNLIGYAFEYRETVAYATPHAMIMQASRYILPRLEGYKIWVVAGSPDTDLGISSVVQYLNPTIKPETYTGDPAALLELLKVQESNYAIIIDPQHPNRVEFVQALLDTEGLHLWLPPQDFGNVKFEPYIVFVSTPQVR